MANRPDLVMEVLQHDQEASSDGENQSRQGEEFPAPVIEIVDFIGNENEVVKQPTTDPKKLETNKVLHKPVVNIWNLALRHLDGVV